MKKKVTKKKKALPALKVITPKSSNSKNTPLFYLCMGENAKGQNITKTTRQCKVNTPALIAQKTKQLQELRKAGQVISKFAQDLEKALKG